MASVFDQYETVVGLECHVQLLTDSKLFSPAPNRYGDAPNQNVDVVDAGLPGVLPVLNGRVVEHALKLGLALGCRINRRNVFARKHYFYPDLPKGYQISQYDLPICEHGALVVQTEQGEKRIGITRIHVEEDAGKLLHEEQGGSAADYNRAGTPLLEVVTEPDIRTPEEAMAFFKALRQLVVYLGVCDGNLQEGSMRADCNVSVRKKGSEGFGQRTETKNINSIRFVGDAVAHEARRQVLEIEAGRRIVMETRLWDPDRRESRSMRSKEEAHDYRYFPDPDLPPLEVGEDEIERVRAALPELPRDKARRFVEKLGLTPYDAAVLTAEKKTADYFEEALAHHKNAKGIANWVINEVLRLAAARAGASSEEPGDVRASGVPPAAVAAIVALVDEGTISGKIGKDVLAEVAAGRGDDPRRIVEEKGWKVQRDEGALRAAVDEVLRAQQGEVEKYRAGKKQVFGFLVGQVMKATKGKADPAEVNRLLHERLAGGDGKDG